MGSQDVRDKRLRALRLAERRAGQEVERVGEDLPDLAENVAVATEEQLDALRAELERGGQRRRERIERSLAGIPDTPEITPPAPIPEQDADATED